MVFLYCGVGSYIRWRNTIRKGVRTLMTLDINAHEAEHLLSVLEDSHRTMMQELSHTDALSAKSVIREKLDVLDRITLRLKNLRATTTGTA